MQSRKYIEIPGKVCRVLMVTFLLCLMLMIVQAITLEMTRTMFTDNRTTNQNQEVQQEPIDHQELVENSRRLFLHDGTVHLAYRNNSQYEEQQLKIYDTNDNLLWQGKDSDLPDKYLKWSNTTQYYRNYNYYMYIRNAVYPGPRRSVIIPVLNRSEIINMWRYDYLKEYFEGYDKDGNIIAYCGSNGFTREKSEIKPLGIGKNIIPWIPVDGGGPIVMWAYKSDLYQIDFRKQTFKTLLHLPDDEIRDILTHNWMSLSPDGDYYQISEDYRPLLTCKTEHGRTYVVLRDPNESFQIKVPEGLKVVISEVTATKEKIYMLASYSSLIYPKEIPVNYDEYTKWRQERMNKPIEYAEELYEVDSAGNIKLINRYEWEKLPKEVTVSRESLHMQKITSALSKISPAFYDILNRFVFARLIRYNSEFLKDLRSFFMFAPNINVYSYLLSLILAGFVFIHAWPRRKCIVCLIAWIVFVFLFNVVGLLVYLALNFTPTIKCQKCNKKRGLNTPNCPRCGAELSTMSPDKLCLITES